MDKLRAWVRQPTTVAGISAVIATISGLLLKQLSWEQAIPLLVGSAVSMVLPDDSAARQQAQHLADEMVTTIRTTKGAA